jgi:hypothetical protein
MTSKYSSSERACFTLAPGPAGLWLLAVFGLSTTRALRLAEDQIHFFVHFAFLTELIFAK